MAEELFDRFMTPYNALVDAIMAETAGEGIFVRPGLEAVGLAAGVSRLPSRDTALTPEIKQAFCKLLDDARAAENDAILRPDGTGANEMARTMTSPDGLHDPVGMYSHLARTEPTEISLSRRAGGARPRRESPRQR